MITLLFAGLALAALLALPAHAGGRPRFGGALKIAAVARSVERDPLLADTPVEAAALSLSAAPPCRLGELSSPAPNLLRLALAPGQDGEAIARALTRARASTSPYRALLAPVKRVTGTRTAVDFQLEGKAPDLDRVLCHPSLAAAPGPFFGPSLAANAAFPAGRPYLDAAAVVPADARTADRQLAQRRVQLVLGSGPDEEGPQLFATWLVAAPKLAPHVKQAVESTIERADLVRFFVRAPASALTGLVPPSLGGPTVAPPSPPRPAPLSPPKELTLLYDAGLDDHRAVAERLQVKLLSSGYKLVLTGLERAELRTRWAKGDYELMLASALLPESKAFALALTAEVARVPTAAPFELFSLTEPADLLARADALRASLPLVPLYVQGLSLGASKDLRHLTRDGLGLPRLDDAFLSGD